MRMFLTLPLVMLCACSTNEGGYTNAASVEQKLVGMNKVQVVASLGAPRSRVSAAPGYETWTYYNSDVRLTGGTCTVLLTFNGEKTVEAHVAARDISFVSFPLGSCSPILGGLR